MQILVTIVEMKEEIVLAPMITRIKRIEMGVTAMIATEVTQQPIAITIVNMTIAPTIETTEIIKHISSVNKEVTIYLFTYVYIRSNDQLEHF